jgi:hypothetical protein
MTNKKANVVRFAQGEVFYVKPDYVGNKSCGLKTDMRLGSRPELIISSDEFNTTHFWRLTVPITTHEFDGDDAHQFFFNELRKDTNSIFVEEIRYRHIDDLSSDKGSSYMYRISDCLLSNVIGIFKNIIGGAENDVCSNDITEESEKIQILLEQNAQLKLQIETVKHSESQYMTLQNENHILKEELAALKQSNSNNVQVPTSTNPQVTKFQNRYKGFFEKDKKQSSTTFFDKMENAVETKIQRCRWTEETVNTFIDDHSAMTVEDMAEKYHISIKSVHTYFSKFYNQRKRGEPVNVR